MTPHEKDVEMAEIYVLDEEIDRINNNGVKLPPITLHRNVEPFKDGMFTPSARF